MNLKSTKTFTPSEIEQFRQILREPKTVKEARDEMGLSSDDFRALWLSFNTLVKGESIVNRSKNDKRSVKRYHIEKNKSPLKRQSV